MENENATTGLRSIVEIVRDLSQPIKQRHLKTKKQGGSTLTFLPWYYAVMYLDQYAPGWSYRVEQVVPIPAGNDIFYHGRPIPLRTLKDPQNRTTIENDKLRFVPAYRVSVVVSISIPCLEGVVTRYATGQEEDEVTGYGDSTSNSESMALRRAAAKFGLGLSLYYDK